MGDESFPVFLLRPLATGGASQNHSSPHPTQHITKTTKEPHTHPSPHPTHHPTTHHPPKQFYPHGDGKAHGRHCSIFVKNMVLAPGIAAVKIEGRSLVFYTCVYRERGGLGRQCFIHACVSIYICVYI